MNVLVVGVILERRSVPAPAAGVARQLQLGPECSEAVPDITSLAAPRGIKYESGVVWRVSGIGRVAVFGRVVVFDQIPGYN